MNAFSFLLGKKTKKQMSSNARSLFTSLAGLKWLLQQSDSFSIPSFDTSSTVLDEVVKPIVRSSDDNLPTCRLKYMSTDDPFTVA